MDISQLISDVCGVLHIEYPDADTGALQNLTYKLGDAAGRVDDVITNLENAVSSAMANNHGQALEAFKQSWQEYSSPQGGALWEFHDFLENSASGAEGYAWSVDNTHAQLERAVSDALDSFAEGIFITIITAGAGGEEAVSMVAKKVEPVFVRIVSQIVGSLAVAASSGAIVKLTTDAINGSISQLTGQSGIPPEQALKDAGIGALGGFVGSGVSQTVAAAAKKTLAELDTLSTTSDELSPETAPEPLYASEWLDNALAKQTLNISASALSSEIMNGGVNMTSLIESALDGNLSKAIRNENEPVSEKDRKGKGRSG
jgi:hypothetical protein